MLLKSNNIQSYNNLIIPTSRNNNKQHCCGGKMGSFSIDGTNIPFEQGDTILRASERAGINIPKLCDIKGLSPFGGCRMCIVKVEGLRGYPTACTTIVSEGMKVTAFDDELKKMRQTILKLILVEHPSACMLCPDKVDCFEIRPRPHHRHRSRAPAPSWD